MNIWAYRFVTYLITPFLFFFDTWRTFKQPIYKAYHHERWTYRLPHKPKGKPVIWVHAVSVGETQASAPLINEILKKHPDIVILLTHMTPTGRDTGTQIFKSLISSKQLFQCYLPYDIQLLTWRFLKHFHPVIGILMETEVWPNLIQSCNEQSIPLGLANARLSEKSMMKFLRFPRLSSACFNSFAWVAAQSIHDAQRISRLRKNSIEVVGNLKFDVKVDVSQIEQGKAFRRTVNRTVLALASTREGEEAMLFEVILPWIEKQSIKPLILLIPRHPKRTPELITLLQGLSLNYAQRALHESVTPQTQVYLCNTLGEMWLHYGSSDIVVMGGGWQPLGGQNLIEPCLAGCATVVGPHMYNFSAVTEDAVAQGAVLQCRSILDLPTALNTLSDNTAIRQQCLTFAMAHTGSAHKHLQLLERSIALGSVG